MFICLVKEVELQSVACLIKNVVDLVLFHIIATCTKSS